MNAYLARLKEWFGSLAPRERVMVSVCAAFTAFTVLYLGIWETLSGAHEKSAMDLTAARANATRLEKLGAAVTQARRMGGGAAVNSSMSLLAAVDQSGKAGMLSKPPSRMQPEGDNEVKVWLEDVTFDGLVRWIADLEAHYGIIAQTVDIEKEPAPGTVNARVSLVRP